jgi:glycerol-3-phosphate acyltransferase PlsY
VVAFLGLAVGYVVGSLPWTWLLGRWRGVDLRRSGTGNVGSANLARSSGVGIAVMGFTLDAGKGWRRRCERSGGCGVSPGGSDRRR